MAGPLLRRYNPNHAIGLRTVLLPAPPPSRLSLFAFFCLAPPSPPSPNPGAPSMKSNWTIGRKLVAELLAMVGASSSSRPGPAGFAPAPRRAFAQHPHPAAPAKRLLPPSHSR